MIVRDADAGDVPAIVQLHNAWIPTLTITWTDALQTEEECARWFESQRVAGRPLLVAEDEGRVVGYASYAPFRGEGASSGYRGTVEQSVHVHQDHWGRGVGRALVEALAERAQAAGVHVIVAGIDSENEASIRFHARLGFVEVARMPETGQKFGRWLHLVLMQRTLDLRAAPD